MIEGQMHCEADARLASQPGAGQDMQAVPIYRCASAIINNVAQVVQTHTTISVTICHVIVGFLLVLPLSFVPQFVHFQLHKTVL